ncbi:LysR family transcriptional regulator [Methylobacterium mesophilicum]
MSQLLHLRTFLEIYRAGSVTRAAERLGMTQPAASGHLSALEATLGKPLFLRQARGVRPTAAADDLAHAVAASLDHIEATMSAAGARSQHLTGTVHLIGPAEYLSGRLGPLLMPLAVEGLRFRIQTGNRERIYAGLDGDHADLAVTASRPDPQRYGFVELDTERQVLVAAPEVAARAKGRSLTADLLVTMPCLAYDETLPLIRPYFEHVFGRHPEMQAVATAPDLRILLGLAEAGTGWTVLPDYLCAEALAAGRLVELPTAKSGPDNTLYLVWNRSVLRHPRVVHVRDRLLQTMGRPVPPQSR